MQKWHFHFPVITFRAHSQNTAKNQRLKAKGMRRKEKHFNVDNSIFCLTPCTYYTTILPAFFSGK
jgi:hypothetical protein